MNSTALITSDDVILRREARSVLNEMQIACTCSGTTAPALEVILKQFNAVQSGAISPSGSSCYESSPAPYVSNLVPLVPLCQHGEAPKESMPTI
jgi:hypothetical protein